MKMTGNAHPGRVWQGALLLSLFLLAAVTAGDEKIRHHQVEITGLRFVPDSITVAPGDTVTWTNRDIAPHTATSTDGSWDTGTLHKGESKTLTVGEEFSTAYRCVFHPGMKGQLEAGKAD